MFCVFRKENDDSLLQCTQNLFLSFLKKLGSLDWFLGLRGQFE